MAWMRNALGSRVTNVKVRPGRGRPLLGCQGSRDHTAGQPAGSESLAWWEFSQGSSPWRVKLCCVQAARHVTATLQPHMPMGVAGQDRRAWLVVFSTF